MPFDRMVKAVDEWAGRNGRTDVIAQIGPTDWRPEHIEWRQFIEPDEFERLFADADAIVAHAGMGTIFLAMQFGKPLLVMPRRADLMETRNDHQLDTVKRFQERVHFDAAQTEEEMSARLDALATLGPTASIRPYASEELVDCLRDFIESE